MNEIEVTQVDSKELAEYGLEVGDRVQATLKDDKHNMMVGTVTGLVDVTSYVNTMNYGGRGQMDKGAVYRMVTVELDAGYEIRDNPRGVNKITQYQPDSTFSAEAWLRSLSA